MQETIVHYEGLNKALSDVTEHQISLWKSSKDNNSDWTCYVDRFKNQKIRSWFCEKTFDGYFGQVRL